MQLQDSPGGLYLCSSGPMRGLELVLSGVERASDLPDLIELEKALNLLRALSRLHEDETDNISTRKRDLGVLRIPG